MRSNQNKIKLLDKIIKIKLKIFFGVFLFMGILHGSQSCAMEGTPVKDGVESDFGSPLYGDTSRLVSSTSFQSPEVDLGKTYESDDMDKSGEADKSKFMVNPLNLNEQNNNQEENNDQVLYTEIDATPIEDEIERIIDYLCYMRGGNKRSEIIKQYSKQDRTISELEAMLLTNAEQAAETSLPQFLGQLLNLTDELQAKCRSLEAQYKSLEKEFEQTKRTCEDLKSVKANPVVIKWAEALGESQIPITLDLPDSSNVVAELYQQTVKLKKEHGALKRQNALYRKNQKSTKNPNVNMIDEDN